MGGIPREKCIPGKRTPGRAGYVENREGPRQQRPQASRHPEAWSEEVESEPEEGGGGATWRRRPAPSGGARRRTPQEPLAAAPRSRILCRSVSAAAASFPPPPPRPPPPPPPPRRGARRPRRAPGRAVPCCPGGGAEGWRHPSLRPPRDTCGCCGCCSPASSSARPCAVPPPAARVSECGQRRPRGAPGPGIARRRGAVTLPAAAALARAAGPASPGMG